MFTIPPRGDQLLLLALVICAAVFDARFRRIPNWLTAGGALLGISLNAFIFYPGWTGLWLALKGFALAFAVNIVLYMLRARSGGDVKLMAAIGAIVGPADWFGIFIVSAIVGGILALLISVSHGRLRRTFSNLGFILNEVRSLRPAYLKNEELDVRSEKGSRLPAGVSIAIGTLVFLVLARHYAM